MNLYKYAIKQHEKTVNEYMKERNRLKATLDWYDKQIEQHLNQIEQLSEHQYKKNMNQ